MSQKIDFQDETIHKNCLMLLNGIMTTNSDQALKIIDLIPAGISFAIDSSCQKIVYNKRAAKFFRLPLWNKFSPLETFPAKIFHHGRELTSWDFPLHQACWKGQNVKDLELEFIWEDGVRKISLWNAAPIFNAKGAIVGAVAAFEDISWYRLTQGRNQHQQAMLDGRDRGTDKLTAKADSVNLSDQEFYQSRECFFEIFHNSPDMACLIRMEDLKYVEINNKVLQTFGYQRHEVIGKNLNALKIVVNQQNAEVPLQEYLAKEKRLNNIRVSCHTKSGKNLLAFCSTETIFFKEKEHRLVLLKDVTNELKLEAEVAKLDRLHLVGEMAAGIAHEIRNPMTTVRGFLQLFKEKQEFAEYASNLSLMVRELDRANSIITEFLNLAKNKKSDKKQLQLNEIIKRLFPLLQADAVLKDKYISIDLADLPPIMLDEKEISQLLYNLVRNGLEAMQPGGCVEIMTFCRGEEVILAVRDQGTGISPQVMEKLGTPFFTTKHTGTGMGLAVCYSIAARHNAKIEIDTSSLGTTFYVRFKV